MGQIMNNVLFTIQGKKAALDGYLEVLLGTLFMAGLLVKHEITKAENGDQVTIFVQSVLRDPPLGHLGISDIPDADRKYGDDF